MKYYERKITKREAINRFGKMGYVPYTEYFKTSNEKFVDTMNKGKKVRFAEVPKDKKFIHIKVNEIITERA